jgi:hypothetical protein
MEANGEAFHDEELRKALEEIIERAEQVEKRIEGVLEKLQERSNCSGEINQRL